MMHRCHVRYTFLRAVLRYYLQECAHTVHTCNVRGRVLRYVSRFYRN